MLTSRSYFAPIKRLNHRWIRPEGHDTGVKVFNCVTKDKQPLIVKNENLVTWYTCGPTVYDSAHIGHASCFLKLDIIQKILKHYFNLNLVTVMNVTDVDDKIIARSNASKIPVQELTQKYEREFWKDMQALEVAKPDCVLRVTENMAVIKDFVGTLMEGNKAYQAHNKSVYFDVGAYDNYGKLQNLSAESSENVKGTVKKSSMDFALWKAAKPGEIYWESPWGDGRPGWHVECSALASRVFGSEIDIHAGGVDLRFPHHENEEAQSCALHNKKQWVNYWVHTGHLHLKNCEKMSKSLKNTVSVATLLENATPQVFRMACLMSHYRKNMEFSPEFLATASTNLQNYKNFVDICKNYLNGFVKADVNSDVLYPIILDATVKIKSALADDFNTPVVVNVLNEVVSAINSILHSTRSATDDSKSVAVVGVLNLVLRTLDTLGIHVDTRCGESDSNFVEVMNILSDFRQSVRQLGISNKDKQLLELCDEVRNSLKSCGINVKDHGKLSSWS